MVEAGCAAWAKKIFRKCAGLIKNSVDVLILKITRSKNVPVGPDYGYSSKIDNFIKMLKYQTNVDFSEISIA